VIKRNRVAPVIDKLTQVLDEKEEIFIKSWYPPGARGYLVEARRQTHAKVSD
jgi:hypothetical protein